MGALKVGSRVVSLADDFLKMFPRKVLSSCNSLRRSVVVWSLQVTPDGGLCYCSNCCTHVVEVTLRYKLKIEACHWDETGAFVLFYSNIAHLLGKSVEKGLEYAFSYDDSFKSKLEPPFPTLAGGDNVEVVYDITSNEIGELVETRVIANSVCDPSSSSSGQL
ncbi:hypothetical protein SESBI_30071 [Sesbania bispinosa]|nr:hypothetical protein SESBI_30071 [Sesbania bispinosa]